MVRHSWQEWLRFSSRITVRPMGGFHLLAEGKPSKPGLMTWREAVSMVTLCRGQSPKMSHSAEKAVVWKQQSCDFTKLNLSGNFRNYASRKISGTAHSLHPSLLISPISDLPTEHVLSSLSRRWVQRHVLRRNRLGSKDGTERVLKAESRCDRKPEWFGVAITRQAVNPGAVDSARELASREPF
jgi:hypothetical protein